MKKILIVYYSRRGENFYDGNLRYLEVGNTEKAARLIADAVGGELFEVDTVKPYASEYRACCGEAVAEWKSGARPEIKGYAEGLDSCDTIFVGYAIWCGTMPMCLFTFLEHYDLTGKTIVPFCTHEGSGFGNSLEDLKRVCHGAVIGTALEVKGCKVEENAERIAAWAREQM